MARVHPIFPNFTAGELTPLLYSRVDFEKYANGARQLVNMFVRPHGPVERRGGLHWVAEVKDSTKKVSLIRFEFSVEQAYIIEFGHQYMRFYKDGGRIENPPGTPTEVATAYTEAQLPEVKYIQSADTMYLFHRSHPVRKLIRFSHTSWSLKDVNFLPPATFEDGFAPNTTLTLGAATGLGIAATSGAAAFEAGDVGRVISQGDGRAVIKTFTSTTQVTVDIVDDFSGTGPFAANTWVILGSPNAQLTPSAAGPRHSIITLTLNAAGWRNTDVGRYVRVSRGVVRITQFSSNTVVSGEVLTPLQNSNAVTGGGWSIESSAWTPSRGFPQCGAFFEQRMVVAGTLAQPQSMWGSESGNIESFGLGSDDDDSFEFKIAANDVNTILWIIPTRVLLLGSASTEFHAEGGNDNPVTPTNINVKPETYWGSGFVRPSRIASAAIFVGRSGRDVRELLFSTDRDQYLSNNLLLLAEHLTRKHTVTDLAYQRTPHSTVWCIRSDGALLCMTYQREHNVIAWSRHYTGQDKLTAIKAVPTKGKFEAVAVIPHWAGDREVAWFVVNRNINGVQKRYIEYIDETEGFYGSIYVDSGLVYNGAPANVFSGLSHLNGETVDILGDGAVYPSETVSGGQVTLNGPPASKIEIGLPYISLLETMRPEVPIQGTSQGRMKHWAEIIVRLDESLGCVVEGEEQPFRSSQDLMDAPPPLLTGDVVIRTPDRRDPDGTVTVEQRQPLPLTVTGIFGTMGVGD